MTDPADSAQLHNTVSLQGATIGKHEELLQNRIEGLHNLEECHDHMFNSLLEQATMETSRALSDLATSNASPQPTPASRELRLPPPERYAGEYGTCRASLAQCSLAFELQPFSFLSDCSRIEYIITLTSGRALAGDTAVWEQESAICFSLEELVTDVRKVFDSLLSGRERLLVNCSSYVKNPVVGQTILWILAHWWLRVPGTRKHCLKCSFKDYRR